MRALVWRSGARLATDPPVGGRVDVMPPVAGPNAFARLAASPPPATKILLEAV